MTHNQTSATDRNVADAIRTAGEKLQAVGFTKQDKTDYPWLETWIDSNGRKARIDRAGFVSYSIKAIPELRFPTRRKTLLGMLLCLLLA